MRFSARLFLITAVAVACDNGPTEPEFQGDFNVTNFRWFLELGDSIRFVTEGPGSRNVEWSSSKPAVVSIDRDGLAIAHSLGAAEIRASPSWSWRLVVVRRVSAIKVMPDSIAIIAGDRVRFGASAVDAQGVPVTDEAHIQGYILGELVWSVADPTIARPDESAPLLVTGLREGRTTVRASNSARTGTATLTVQLLEFSELAAGGSFNCGLAADALPYCWGDVILFLAPAGRPETPAHVPRLAGRHPPMTLVVSGGGHACGLSLEGLAYCWGSNSLGALGIGGAGQPAGLMPVSGGLRFVNLSAGSAHTCGISTNGRTYCWGRRNGVAPEAAPEICSLSSKGVETRLPCDRAPVPVGDGTLTFGSLSAGESHTCGLNQTGHAYCWGKWGSRVEPLPVPIGGPLVFSSLTSGSEYSCGLTNAGQAWCWGTNGAGQLGDGSTTASDEPVAVAGGLTFRSLSASLQGSGSSGLGGHICGVTLQDLVYCWGVNTSGELGVPASEPRTTPLQVATPLSFRWVRAGGAHTCGLALDKALYCWGDNSSGQLGTPGGPQSISPSPVRVIGQRSGAP